MDFSTQSRRQRPSRYPAPDQYEDGYAPNAPYEDLRAELGNGSSENGYRGRTGLVAGPRQRAPWEDEPQATRAQNTGAFFAAATDTYVPTRNTGAFQANTGAFQANTGAFRTNTGAFQANTGAFQAATTTTAAEDYDDRPIGRGRAVTPRRNRGLLVGGIAGFLAAAVTLGVANLAAAFVRPQASPILAAANAFIGHTPPALKNFAVEKFGMNEMTVLQLGMYVAIGLIAIVVGMIAGRRPSVGAMGIAFLGLLGAFFVITRPESRATDVIPSIIGGFAGIPTIVWLIRAGTRRAGSGPRVYGTDPHQTGWTA